MAEQLAQTHYYGPWMLPWKVTKCLCSDGKRRTAWISGQADTFFSIPARVKAKGKTVSGYVTGCETDGQYDSQFRQVKYGKNYAALPEWK